MKYDAKIIKLAGAYYTDARGVIFAILRASGVNAAAAYTRICPQIYAKIKERDAPKI